MAVVKCPRCGYTKRKEILYGFRYLSPEEEKKYTLGGCLITTSNPKWYCTKCRHSYGMKLFRDNNIFSFYLQITSFVSKTIHYTINFFEPRSFTKVENHGTSSEITTDSIVHQKHYTESEWRKFMIKLDNLYLFAIKTRYVDKEVIDGTSWNLEIDSFIQKKSKGLNSYPIYWKKIIKTLNQEFDKT